MKWRRLMVILMAIAILLILAGMIDRYRIRRYPFGIDLVPIAGRPTLAVSVGCFGWRGSFFRELRALTMSVLKQPMVPDVRREQLLLLPLKGGARPFAIAGANHYDLRCDGNDVFVRLPNGSWGLVTLAGLHPVAGVEREGHACPRINIFPGSLGTFRHSVDDGSMVVERQESDGTEVISVTVEWPRSRPEEVFALSDAWKVVNASEFQALVEMPSKGRLLYRSNDH